MAGKKGIRTLERQWPALAYLCQMRMAASASSAAIRI